MFSLSIFPFVWMGERNFISRDLFLRSWGLLYSSIKMQTAERRIIAWEGIASCTELEDYFIRLFPTCCSWLRAKCSGNGTCSGLLQESVSRSESGRKGAKGFWGPGRDFMGLKNGGGGNELTLKASTVGSWMTGLKGKDRKSWNGNLPG